MITLATSAYSVLYQYPLVDKKCVNKKTTFCEWAPPVYKLGGYETSSVIPGKLCELKAGNAICFRIANPRAMRGQQKYRDEVIDRINQLCNAGC
ncbi:hypothetical protein DQ149_24715 [Escherichia coli]|nr:hypothetical protein [Salmonella enterica]EEW6005531.1 hypothetical protein [Escherichia coli]EFN8292179.1 hypothetical protein [Escherichia coli]EFO2977480.1 hypothetical protein [Escherichia coli]MBQ4744972.1 hypothetical protein [Escherichia coli]